MWIQEPLIIYKRLSALLNPPVELFHLPIGVVAHARPIVHNQDVHPGRVVQPRQQLWSQQEILGTCLVAGSPHL